MLSHALPFAADFTSASFHWQRVIRTNYMHNFATFVRIASYCISCLPRGERTAYNMIELMDSLYVLRICGSTDHDYKNT